MLVKQTMKKTNVSNLFASVKSAFVGAVNALAMVAAPALFVAAVA